MAPSLEENTIGHASVDTPAATPAVETPSQVAATETIVDGPIASEPVPAAVDTAGAGSHVRSAGPPIPGPLGIESASLKGKVALVTGAGIYASPSPPSLYLPAI